MAHSNEANVADTKNKAFFTEIFSNSLFVISLIAIALMLIGNFLISLASPQEKRIMAPGPLGSTDSISQPVG